MFGFSAATTHLLSAVTHVWPDSHALEKADHYGIVVLIVGVTASALLAVSHGKMPRSMAIISACLAVAAALRPLPRVLGYATGVASFFTLYARQIGNANLVAQMAMYATGGWCFLRNGGHTERPYWLSDHHLLHYLVTGACGLHLVYIGAALEQTMERRVELPVA